jgi:transcriptional regulator with PAS, ATPase and Fis domain
MFTKNKKLFQDFLTLIGSPLFDADTALFRDAGHPVVIRGRDSAFCRRCEGFDSCTAAMEVYIPSFGRFLYREEYRGDLDLLLSLLCNIAVVMEDFRSVSRQSDNLEFYRQLLKKAIDLNPHAISAVDAEGALVYQNIIAQNGNWNDEKTKNAVVFPLFKGSKNLGKIVYVKSQNFSSHSPLSAGNSREIAFHHILGTDPAIVNCIDISMQVSATNSTTLILGESGTGKEIFAKAIHEGSPRKNGAFVAINCAAIPEDLLESELFGYAEGAFTGAKKGGKTGRIVLADRGTLFLDEIGDLPLSLQAKLLRVLQDKKVEPVGSLKSVSVDVRYICATNKNIEALVRDRLFREDLYYRINVIPIHIPPLRTRKNDILILLHHNIKKYCVLNERPFKNIDPGLVSELTDYEWKGNVRELENVAEYAVTMCNGDCITADHLPAYLKKILADRGRASRTAEAEKAPLHPPPPAGNAALGELIGRYGFDTEGKKKIAEALGISLATLYRRIKSERI